MSDLKDLYFKKRSLVYGDKNFKTFIKTIIVNFKIRRFIHKYAKGQAKKAYDETNKLLSSVFNIEEN